MKLICSVVISVWFCFVATCAPQRYSAQGATVVSAEVQLREPQTFGPGPRRGHLLVYDEQLRCVLLVDASIVDSVRPRAQEIWSWDGGRWKLVNTSRVAPAAHSTNAAAYDALRKRVVMHGGRIGAMGQEDVVADTWEWDGARWLEAANANGPARDHHAMVYDFARQKIVMFGGTSFPRGLGMWTNDTWEFDGKEWTQLATDGPLGRISAMAFDRKRNVIVLFGGHGDGQPARYYDDTWIWDGKTWRKVVEGGPVARTAHAMSYDGSTGVVLVYGGGARIGGQFQEVGDFWQWDGVRWSEIFVTGLTPRKRTGSAMVYDAARGKTVLYGGGRREGGAIKILDDLWEWDGKRWEQVK